MDDFLIIKSKEDIEDLFLYIKKFLKDKYNKECVIHLKSNEWYKIYIKKDSFNIATEAVADFLIRNYVFFFVQDYIDDIGLTDILVDFIKNYKNGWIIESIKKDLTEFSKLFNDINISGYILFAFRKYENIIDQAIGEAIIFCSAEEESERFLSLVSEYVDESYSEIDVINIIKQPNDSYIYLDKDLNIIDDLQKDKTMDELDNGIYTREDEILNVLISLKPTRINLHLNNEKMNMNFIMTLEAIFGDRIKICTNGCSICKS